MTATGNADVEEHYDSPAGQLGPLLFGGHLHWGYWDAEHATDTFAQAADRLTRMMIARTEIGAGDRFIDLGCGVGLPAIELAKAKGCYVDGVTISKFQQRSATERGRAAGLQDQIHFTHGTALALPFENASYDGGWFFESIFHMGHREALAEAARVLKPGAALLLTDLPTLPTTTDDFRAFAREHIHSGFVAEGDYPDMMAGTGFDLVAVEDITAHVMPWLAPKLRETLDEHRDAVYSLIEGDVEKAMDNWLYLFEYMSEQLGYIIVKARRA